VPGKVLSISAGHYSGTPVTTCSLDVKYTPATRRLDRCFVKGPKQKHARTTLRVISGVRRQKLDPSTLDRDDFDSAVDSVDVKARFVRLC
jgi:hypothetical protein